MWGHEGFKCWYRKGPRGSRWGQSKNKQRFNNTHRLLGYRKWNDFHDHSQLSPFYRTSSQEWLKDTEKLLGSTQALGTGSLDSHSEFCSLSCIELHIGPKRATKELDSCGFYLSWWNYLTMVRGKYSTMVVETYTWRETCCEFRHGECLGVVMCTFEKDQENNGRFTLFLSLGKRKQSMELS